MKTEQQVSFRGFPDLAPYALKMITPVILSGGAGTRLWPLRAERWIGEDDIVRFEDVYGRQEEK